MLIIMINVVVLTVRVQVLKLNSLLPHCRLLFYPDYCNIFDFLLCGFKVLFSPDTTVLLFLFYA